MTFFTTSELLEIGGHPLVSLREKPDRKEALNYYRLVTEREDLNIKQYHKVSAIHKVEKGGFHLEVDKDGLKALFETRCVVIATGYYDNPNLLGIPGEENENASHYYTEGHSFWGLKVTLIGAGNSAADAALDLYRHGAKVTLIVRSSQLKSSIKYWVKPDLENRIREGAITAHFESHVTEILEDRVMVHSKDKGTWELETDFTFALTGYHPNTELLLKCGVQVDDEGRAELNQNFESNVPGLFICGSAGFGKHTNQVFIENGRAHALLAIQEIKNLLQQRV